MDEQNDERGPEEEYQGGQEPYGAHDEQAGQEEASACLVCIRVVPRSS